jgi:hypothetical protein
MKNSHSLSPYGAYVILAPAAQAALYFAARRNTPARYGAWHSITLYWRRQRQRLEGVWAGSVALAAGSVWFPSFHLHFLTHMNDRHWRGPIPRSFPVAAMYQWRVVMAYGGAMVQSNTIAPRQYHDQRPEHVFSHRQELSGSKAKMQNVSPYTRSARRRVMPPSATQSSQRGQSPVYIFSLRDRRIGLDTSVLDAALYASTALRALVPSTATRKTVRNQRPSRERANLSVHAGTDTQAQILPMFETSKPEPLAFRLRFESSRNAALQYLQESAAGGANFHPQDLIWRRAVPSAAGITSTDLQSNTHELAHHSLSRLFPGQDASSGLPHPSGHAPVAPALTIDSALMDRLADDVIRRVERRERLERARRGL